jgi:hypothetical protein
MNTCKIADCNKKHSGHGYCGMHLLRFKRYGDTSKVLCNRGKYKSFIESFEDNVIRHVNGCWNWKGVISRHGYAMIYANGKTIRAHRFSYSYFSMPIKDGLIICHTCDNTLCTNPKHLFQGTHKDNTQDCISKNRFKIPENHTKVCGSKHGRAKLKEEDVYKIKQMINDGITNKPIAKMFGVHHGTISLIRLGKNWKHIKIGDKNGD